MKATEVIRKLYHNKFISRLFHTSVYCLKRELKDCNSVLDLGCGPDSPLKNCDARYSVGVDVFEPYVKASKDKRIHDEYIISDIRNLNFKLNSFDAVILIEVLEHLTKQDGEVPLHKAESWARKKVIVSSPNGYLPQFDINGNPFSRHRSGWEIREIRGRGYNAYGMAGWKPLRKENISEKMEDENAIFSTIRFRPKLFWLMISELTQIITYYFPKAAFEVFYVKNLEEIR